MAALDKQASFCYVSAVSSSVKKTTRFDAALYADAKVAAAEQGVSIQDTLSKALERLIAPPVALEQVAGEILRLHGIAPQESEREAVLCRVVHVLERHR